jgi:hypothetical protein
MTHQVMKTSYVESFDNDKLTEDDFVVLANSNIEVIIRLILIHGFFLAMTCVFLKNHHIDTITTCYQDYYKMEISTFGQLVAHEYHFRNRRSEDKSSWRDSYFTFCGALYIRTAVEMYSRYASRLNSPVYRYELSYQTSSSASPSYIPGALREEIILAFPTLSTKFNDADEKISDLFIRSLTNFVKVG